MDSTRKGKCVLTHVCGYVKKRWQSHLSLDVVECGRSVEVEWVAAVGGAAVVVHRSARVLAQQTDQLAAVLPTPRAHRDLNHQDDQQEREELRWHKKNTKKHPFSVQLRSVSMRPWVYIIDWLCHFQTTLQHLKRIRVENIKNNAQVE